MSRVGERSGCGGAPTFSQVLAPGEVAKEEPGALPLGGSFKKNFPSRDGAIADKGSFAAPTCLESMPAEIFLDVAKYMHGADLKEMEFQNQRLKDISRFESKRRADEQRDYEGMNQAASSMLSAWAGYLAGEEPQPSKMDSIDSQAQLDLLPKRARFISRLADNLLILANPERRRQEGAAAFSNILSLMPTLDPDTGAQFAEELALFAGTRAFANMYPPGEGGRPSPEMLAAIRGLGAAAMATHTNLDYSMAPAVGCVLYAMAKYDTGQALAMLRDFLPRLERMEEAIPPALVFRLAFLGAAMNPDVPGTHQLREEIRKQYAPIYQKISGGSMVHLENRLNRILTGFSIAALRA